MNKWSLLEIRKLYYMAQFHHVKVGLEDLFNQTKQELLATCQEIEVEEIKSIQLKS